MTTSEPTALDVRPNTNNLTVGGSRQLTVTFEPIESEATLTWASADPSVVGVDGSGLITALAAGSTTITATTSNGVSDTVTVNVGEAT